MARLKGDSRAAMEAYRKAFDLCPDKARAGGVRFLQGVCGIEEGNPYLAAESFESAAKIDDFPQADLAAGLSVLAYQLHGKADSLAKAAAVLQLPVARKSPFAQEINLLAVMAKGKSFREHGLSKESASADGATRVWSEYDAYWIPFASTKLFTMAGADGKFIQRHIGLKNFTSSALWTSQSPAAIFRLARPITPPKLSPSGSAIAFTVQGEVFPVADNYCELFAVDLKGAVLIGNAPAAASGKTKGRQIISDFSWANDSEVKLSGVEVDIFGGQKPFEKTVTALRWSGVRVIK
jgi:hypothetical protein